MTAKDIHDLDKDLAVLQKEVDTQFKEIFTRIKRLEAIMIGTSGTIILLLLKMLFETGLVYYYSLHLTYLLVVGSQELHLLHLGTLMV